MIPGQIAGAGSHWVAYFRIGLVLVDMIGHRIDPTRVQLTEVVTLGEYTK